MYELLYSSTAKKDLKEEDISNILETARDFNLKNNLSGCLVFHNNKFIQILEGDEGIVKELFAKIEKDKRHKNVILIEKGLKAERLFENWTMVYYNLDKIDTNDPQRKLFIDNFITYSEIADISTTASKMFWYISKNIFKELK
jgi:hypothetical protein